MNGADENPHEWQKRIQTAFASEGTAVGERYLLNLLQNEKSIGVEYQLKFQGHRLLTEAFFDFFAETLTIVVGRVSSEGWPEQRENYALYVLAFVTLFRTGRAADILAVSGYRLGGYAHLRE